MHPNNEYGFLDISQVHENLENIKQLSEFQADDWREQKLCDVVADYGRREYEFLEANYMYNNAAPEFKKAAAERHRETNEALYGKPDEDTFYAILSEEIAKIKVDELGVEERQKYDKMMADIGPIKEVEGGTYKPKTETVEKFSEYTKLFFEPFLKHVPEEKESFTPEELRDVFNEVINEEFAEGENPYHAIVKEEIANVNVDHEAREIRIPKNVKEPYSNTRCKTLLVHELGTHVLRALPYLGQKVEIFTSGLPGNETFDEGIAKCVEQAIKGRYEDSGRAHYINIGLATFKNKNFREVYNISSTLKELTGQSNKTTLNAVQRCFRGTGELPNNKDLAYYNGSTEVWKYIEKNIDDPELFDNLFLSGKANIENDEQAQLVYEMKMGGINSQN